MQEKLEKTFLDKVQNFFGTYSLYKSNSEALMRKNYKFNKNCLDMTVFEMQRNKKVGRYVFSRFYSFYQYFARLLFFRNFDGF